MLSSLLSPSLWEAQRFCTASSVGLSPNSSKLLLIEFIILFFASPPFQLKVIPSISSRIDCFNPCKGDITSPPFAYFLRYPCHPGLTLFFFCCSKANKYSAQLLFLRPWVIFIPAFFKSSCDTKPPLAYCVKSSPFAFLSAKSSMFSLYFLRLNIASNIGASSSTVMPSKLYSWLNPTPLDSICFV